MQWDLFVFWKTEKSLHTKSCNHNRILLPKLSRKGKVHRIYTEDKLYSNLFLVLVRFLNTLLSFCLLPVTINKGQHSTFATDRRTQLILFSTSLRFSAAASSCIHSFTHSSIHPASHPSPPCPDPSDNWQEQKWNEETMGTSHKERP